LSLFLEPIEIPNPFFIPVYWISECPSTMDLARDLIAEKPEGRGLMVLTGHQTQGRGRQGKKSWVDVPGAAFLSTLWLGPQFTVMPPLSLRVGLAVARTIEESLELPVTLKWPNDIFFSDRKAGGILIENLGPAGHLIGLGLNLRGAPENLNRPRFTEVTNPREATSLATEARIWAQRWGEPVPNIPGPRDFAQAYLQRLHQSLHDLHWRASVTLRLAYRGKVVVLEPPGVRGTLVGLGEAGEVLLDVPASGRKAYFTGSLRLASDSIP